MNGFKDLLEYDENLPPEHKEQVMKTIDTLKLMANMVDMFSVKQAKTNTSVLGKVISPDESSEDDAEG